MWFRIGLLIVLILVILAFKFLPWYVLVALAVAFVLSLKFLGKKLIQWLFSLPFRAKGAALRGATVEVHSITSCARPEPRREEASETDADGFSDDDDDEDESDEGDDDSEQKAELITQREPDEPRHYFRLDATIT